MTQMAKDVLGGGNRFITRAWPYVDTAMIREPSLEDDFAAWLSTTDLPAPERQVRFHPTRRWRFDFAWPAHLIAVEVDGLVYGNRGNVGGHQTVDGILADAEKYEAALTAGWLVYRVPGPWVRKSPTRPVCRPQVIDTIRELLHRREAIARETV